MHGAVLLQAQVDDLDKKISGAQQQLSSERARHAALQRCHVGLSSRVADAATALMAAHASATAAGPGCLPQPPDSAAAHAEHAEHAEHVHGTGSTRTRVATLPSASLRLDDHAPSAVVPVQTRRPGLYGPYTRPPPGISTFRRWEDISHDDLCAVAGADSGLIDFSQHSLTSLIDRAVQKKAAEVGVAGRKGGVCWFVQMKYDVAPAVPLSVSASMSSPECFASYAAQFLLMRFEFIMINAVTQYAKKHDPSLAVAMDELAPPSQKPRHGSTAAPKATDADLHAAQTDVTRPASSASAPAGACSVGGTRSGGDADAAADTDAATQPGVQSTPPHAQQGPRWSGCLRCGVNDKHDVRAALGYIVCSIVRRCCALAPLDVVLAQLQAYHAYLRRSIPVSAEARSQERSAGDERPQRGGSSSGGTGGIMACCVAAALGTAHAMQQVLAGTADMHALQQLVRAPPPQAVTAQLLQNHVYL